MKHIPHKLIIGLLATSMTLSSVNADHPLLKEVPSLVSFESITNPPIAPPSTPVENSSVPVENSSVNRLNNTESIIRSLRDGGAQLEKALLSGAAAQDELITLTKLYNQLKSKFDALSEESKQLITENAVLKAEQEEHSAEKQSTWQRLKNWLFKMDVTKVASTVITSVISVICTLLIIVL
ncbi:MAG: hypothetical protein Q8Q56_02900 [Alphaproteobacteria bacterium]|nr:hypothetical protein [Alphaproteobacteria bacterium]